MNGSVRRRSKNSWELTIDLGRDSDGTRNRKYVNVKGTKSQAQQKLRELVSAWDKGVPLDPSNVTVGEFLGNWLSDYADINTGPRTAEGYRQKIELHITPNIGTIRLKKLAPQHVQNLYSQLTNKGLSARSVTHCHRVLKEALKYAVKWGLLAWNVCDAVSPPRAVRKEMKAMTFEEAQLFLTTAAKSPYGVFFFVSTYTGMRRSELLGLRWSSIDLDRGTISIHETLQRVTGQGLKVLPTKTASARRMIPVPKDVVTLLTGFRIKQQQDCEAIGVPWEQSDLVFRHPDLRPFHPDTLTHAFADVVKKAGISGVRLHDLRHTHASLMLREHVDPKTISARLGHSSVVITLDTYSHLLPGMQEEAIERFSQGMDEARGEDPATIF